MPQQSVHHMNMTITMKMTLVLFWLCSGFFYFTFTSNRLRVFLVPGSKSNLTASLDYCKNNKSSFVTVYDDEDAEFVVNFTKSMDVSFWLGLRKRENLSLITWSNGQPVTFNHSSVNVTNGTQKCEAIVGNTWSGFDCSERKYFMCYKGNNYTLIHYEMNWCRALHYCRKHFTDLVSISNMKQNEEVIEKGNNTTFWIGLLHDDWEWVDKGCSSFRKTANWHNNDKCTAHSLDYEYPNILYKYGCHHQAHPFCSKGTVRIKVIREKLNWEKAFDYCRARHTGLLWIRDGGDESALNQWLNQSAAEGPFWIGLRQSRVFGFWIWTSESNSAVTIDNWKNGEPQLPLSKHCAVIDKTDRKWSDEDCLVEHHFLCEEEIVLMN